MHVSPGHLLVPQQDGQDSMAQQRCQDRTSLLGGQGARVHCQLEARQRSTLTCAQSLSKSKFDERVEAKLNTNNFH